MKALPGLDGEFTRRWSNSVMMSKNLTVVLICILLLFADVLCLRQTLAVHETLSRAQILAFIAGQALLGVFVGSLAVGMIRRRYARQKKPASR